MEEDRLNECMSDQMLHDFILEHLSIHSKKICTAVLCPFGVFFFESKKKTSDGLDLQMSGKLGCVRLQMFRLIRFIFSAEGSVRMD